MQLFKLSAFDLATGIKEKQFSATEVMQSVLQQAQTVQQKCNPFITVDESNALRQANQLDNSGAVPHGPLYGVPFTVKDLLNTKGLRTTYGSRALAENIPQQDAVAVQRMRASGAVLIGKTATPEFATQIRTDSLLNGVTTNPWDPSLSAGGSSGGAGAAVATGASPLDISTDGAGSSRVPASACGILGLKPTLGAIPHETWPFHFGNNSTVSINARSTKDLVTAFNITSGPHALDPWSRRAGAQLSLPALTERTDYRVLYLPTLGGLHADREVLAGVSGMLAQLQALGIHTDEDLTDRTGFDPTIVPRLMTCNLAARFRQMDPAQQALLDPRLHPLLSVEHYQQDAVDLQTEAIARSALYDRTEALFEKYDLIVTPTVAAKPPTADVNGEPTVTVDQQQLDINKWWTHLGLTNMTGHPAISIPCGTFSDGLPIGLHAIGKWDGEQDLVNLAARIEETSPWSSRWPTLTSAG